MVEGSVNVGRSYRVTELLGRGAFGAVYLADTVGAGLPKKVAVKVLNPDRAVSPELVGRLRDEARMLSLIHHRAIVRVDDLVQLNGQWSVIMEYVEGVDLGVLLRKGPVPPRATLAIVAEVAGALHAAYNQTGPDGVALRLVHRDIKPSNVRVTAAGEVKLLDFGVARAEFSDREVGTTHATFGTLSYMSPERFKGEDTHAGDMYAVGIMLFELLTGLRPGASAADPERTPPGKTLRPQWEWIEQLSAPLHELISDLLSPDPTRRPIGKECARTLDRIRGHIAGDTLEDWCEKVVPGVVQSSRMPPDGTAGTLLVEKGPGAVKAAPSNPLRLVGVAGAAAVVLVAGGIWGISQLERPSKGSTPPV
ncbi:MAG TPA: serine/threonine-protein kinase, partial [Myxococcota bacterium]|nr:serine/threonine-protein kinase [Myxococcota bacterium]